MCNRTRESEYVTRTEVKGETKYTEKKRGAAARYQEKKTSMSAVESFGAKVECQLGIVDEVKKPIMCCYSGPPAYTVVVVPNSLQRYGANLRVSGEARHSEVPSPSPLSFQSSSLQHGFGY
ncbi:hypothetical protein DQ04_08861000 [Trypanosoma grayi]|uniref:hypothetical protein n=1 Tax=Trypanosoma grayi TaxID=71804 RepID=UPI0004F46AF8|nr:hypothetical protein DQ04_08861000 [Trypanosoma grayi]KEG07773.1 hypothetical protein DQ04_08861000 [Trypanosoma grayi]